MKWGINSTYFLEAFRECEHTNEWEVLGGVRGAQSIKEVLALYPINTLLVNWKLTAGMGMVNPCSFLLTRLRVKGGSPYLA